MMFLKIFYFAVFLLCPHLILSTESILSSSTNTNDPFKTLGIPDLNPQSILAEIDAQEKKFNNKGKQRNTPKLKSIDDLPNFLKSNSMDEGQGIELLTRFLIQDDLTLKKYGVVYDQTGFDGIPKDESIASVDSEERLGQRARSAANIWFQEKHKDSQGYEAYGADPQGDEIVPNWRIYRVLMIGKNGENSYIKICLPLDESEPALCSENDEPCSERTMYVEQEKRKNEEYINKIKNNNFFAKPSSGKVKLLPGERIIAQQNEKKVVLDSQSMHKNDPINDRLMKKRMNPSNSMQTNPMTRTNNIVMHNIQGMPNMGQQQNIFPNVNGFNPNFNLNGVRGNNIMSNMNGMNMVGLNNMGTNGNIQQQNGIPTQFNFKQKEVNQNINKQNIQNFPEPPQQLQNQGVNPPQPQVSQQPILDNNQLMNEIIQMKNQLNQMMQTIKQKDEIINQQNLKMSQFPNNNQYVNNQQPMNNFMYNEYQNQVAQQQVAPPNPFLNPNFLGR